MLSRRDQTHLKFIYDRLVNVHGEDENFDYMLRLKEIIGALPGPRPASSNNRHTMMLQEKHLNALNYVVQRMAKPGGAPAADHYEQLRLAEEAIAIIRPVFGASSQSYITLYPTIG